MRRMLSKQRVIELLSLAGAIALGPLVLLCGYSAGFMFGVAAMFYFVVCALVIPLLVLIGGRLKFIIWQTAILDLVCSIIIDDIRVGMRFGARELFSVPYEFWLFGTLLSAPLPVYFVLKPLPRRRRYIVGSVIAACAVALYLVSAIFVR